VKDVFLEKIVTHRKSPFELFLKFMIVLTTITVILVVNLNVMFYIPQLMPLALMLSFGLVYLGYRLFTSINVEYEYSLTNDDLTIERISAKRKRKVVFSASCKSFERVAPISDPEYLNRLKSSAAFIDFSSSDREITWYIFLTRGGRKTTILFDYDERFISVFQRYNPRNVVLT